MTHELQHPTALTPGLIIAVVASFVSFRLEPARLGVQAKIYGSRTATTLSNRISLRTNDLAEAWQFVVDTRDDSHPELFADIMSVYLPT